MSCYLPDTKSIFLHIPRTGGTWVKKAMTSVGIRHVEFQNKHGLLCHLFLQEKVVVDSVFAFVRHPVSAYASVWSYLRRSEREPFRISKLSWHPFGDAAREFFWNYEVWVDRMCHRHPGWLSDLYESYVGPSEEGFCRHIGRTENLKEDFFSIMRSLSYNDVDSHRDEIESFGVVNSYGDTEHVEAFREKIGAREKKSIQRFYGGHNE